MKLNEYAPQECKELEEIYLKVKNENPRSLNLKLINDFEDKAKGLINKIIEINAKELPKVINSLYQKIQDYINTMGNDYLNIELEEIEEPITILSFQGRAKRILKEIDNSILPEFKN